MDDEDEMIQVNVKYPKNLLDKIDFWISNKSYSSRSEFIKDAVRTKLNELENSDKYYEEKVRKIE